ncbi:hypothetical protein RLIN73S_02068 [Rhodanobacter lindaniclasticus]
MRILPGDRDHGMAGHRMHHQRSGVIGDLRAMERLYQQAGRGKEMTAVYNDVLAKSQDPQVRDYVYQRLARLQAQPANVDLVAIATLRKGLDENLANEAKMRADREKMRAAWQQRASDAAPPAKEKRDGKGEDAGGYGRRVVYWPPSSSCLARRHSCSCSSSVRSANAPPSAAASCSIRRKRRFELRIGMPQRLREIDAGMARQVHHHEQHVTDLVFKTRRIGTVGELHAHLLHLLGQFLQYSGRGG